MHAADSLIQAIQNAVRSQEPTQEIVILNTEKGFVPASVRVKKGVAYKIHVVNLNMKEKNVSFLMDSFSVAASPASTASPSRIWRD